jgi:predicted DNA-binding transcriptional regulator AlpA
VFFILTKTRKHRKSVGKRARLPVEEFDNGRDNDQDREQLRNQRGSRAAKTKHDADDPDNNIRSLKPERVEREKTSRKVSDAEVVRANPLRLYRTVRLAKLWDVDPATIWRWRKRGVLPPPVHVGGITGWTEEQLKTVIASS